MSDRDGATVATSVLTRSGGEMAVGYRMLARDGSWKVYDVVVDGVSLIDNYRAQFQKVIARSSYAALVTEMHSRIAELGKSEAVPVATLATTVTAPAAPPVAVAAAPPAPPAPIVAPPAPPRASIVVAPPAPVVAPPAPPRAPVVVAPPAPVVVAAVPREAPRPEPRVEGRIEPAEPARPAPRMASLTPPPAPRMTESRTLAGFWVQLGAFSDPARAMKLVDALKDHAVSLLTLPRNPLMVVRVGPFPNREAAVSKLRELRGRGYDGFIAFDSTR